MRVVSANVLHGLDVRRLASPAQARRPEAVDLAAVADWLGPLDADVLLLQEVDHHLPRSGGVDQAAQLGGALGMEAAFVPALAGDPDRAWEEVPAAGLSPGQAGYGVAVLSRIGLSAVRRHRLPHGGPGSRDGGGSSAALGLGLGLDREPRVVATAQVADGVSVATTHLSYMFWQAVPQLGRALALAAGDGGPPGLLVGDLNLPMWGGWLALHAHGLHPWGWPRLATRSAGWRHLAADATFPSWNPRLQLDQVYVRGLGRRASVRVGPAGPSDHLPLVVEW